VYILAHLVEFLLFIRYHALLPFYLLRGSKPKLSPGWIGQLVYLQPSTFEYMCDIMIDDSRARKVLRSVTVSRHKDYMCLMHYMPDARYRPQWCTVQCIRYTVDEMQSGKAREGHGLQLKSD